MEKVRLQKLIAESGMCSRRKAEELIKQGKVTVNGRAAHIGDGATAKDIIAVDGEKLPIAKKREKYYIMLKKFRRSAAVYKRRKFFQRYHAPQPSCVQNLPCNCSSSGKRGTACAAFGGRRDRRQENTACVCGRSCSGTGQGSASNCYPRGQEPPDT